MNPTEILEAARERLDNPERWCKFAYARSGPRDNHRYGAHVGCNSQWAAQWSVPGALLLEGLAFQPERRAAADILRMVSGAKSLEDWNDLVTHTAVLDALDQAISVSRRVYA